MAASPACLEAFSRCLHLDVLPQRLQAHSRVLIISPETRPFLLGVSAPAGHPELPAAPLSTHDTAVGQALLLSPPQPLLSTSLFSAIPALISLLTLFSCLNYCNSFQTGPSATFQRTLLTPLKAGQSEQSRLPSVRRTLLKTLQWPFSVSRIMLKFIKHRRHSHHGLI